MYSYDKGLPLMKLWRYLCGVNLVCIMADTR